MVSRKRTKHGYLILGECYVLPPQERTRRWCFRGAALGALTFLVSVCYVAFKYGKPKGIAGLPRACFTSWSAMASEVQELLLVAIVAWAMFFFSMLALVLLNCSIAQQSVEELGEDG